MGDLSESAHILLRHSIGHQSANVPQKTIRLLCRGDDAAAENRQPHDRIISILLNKRLAKIVGPVLRTHLIAVRHNMREGPALIRRQSFEQLADIGVKMMLGRQVVHFVDLQSGGLRGSRGVLDAGRRHAGAQKDPLPFRHIPGEDAVRLQTVADIPHLTGRNDQLLSFRLLWARPEISIPQRLGRRKHFTQLFFNVSLHTCGSGEMNLSQTCLSPDVVEQHSEFTAGLCGERFDHSALNYRSHLNAGIRAIISKLFDAAPRTALALHLQVALCFECKGAGIDGQAPCRHWTKERDLHG
ncbi:MAG: hypothetical protein BWY83_02832 [bacterium ADurb.Bin478]|nr:MAG: hypothetical protein BWY83_02832 [bacterium ADurb.Bin478]